MALILIVLIGVGLNRVFSWMATSGAAWAEAGVGGHTAWQVLAWVLSIAATLGIITGALFLMPAVTAFVGSFFVDEIADEVERTHYPMEPPGSALPLFRALIEGVNTALLAVAGLSLRACRSCSSRALASSSCSWPTPICSAANISCSPPCAFARRRRRRRCGAPTAAQIFLAGLLIAMFVSIPIVNLATPLFAMAMMVHLHKRLSQRRMTFQPRRA